MPSFTDTFGSVGNWATEAGSDTGHFVANSNPPAGFCDDEGSGQIIYDNSPGSGLFAISRLDTVDGGVAANTSWVAYAFYIADWNELWMGGAGAGSNAKLPGHSYNSDPNSQTGNGFPVVLQPTSATTGTISGTFTGPVSVSHQAWHTVRIGTRIQGVTSHEELWIDGALQDTFDGNSGITGGSFGPMFWDEDAFYTNANVYLQELTWHPSSDPGEPECFVPPNGSGGEGCDLFITLDGTQVTQALRGSVTRRLNRPSSATITVPMDSSIGGAGSRLMVSLDGGANPFFHGMVMDCELDGGEDFGYVTYNAADPMELWAWRPARDPDGDFTNPSFIEVFQTGPQIIETLLQNTEGDSTAQGNPALTPPEEAEGPTFLTFGTFEAGGLSLEGAPVDWPMTIGQIASLLTSTGELDIVITPTDPGGGVMGTVDCYNGDYGTNRSPFGGGSSEVNFQYGFGALNVRALRWNEDMSSIVNKLWYYGGPRIQTASDPEGNQHWCWNITGDDPRLYGNLNNKFGALSGGPFADAGPGGALPTSASYTGGVLGDMRADSQDTAGPAGTGYGVRMEVRVWDAASDLCNSSLGVAERWLYRAQWQAESWARVFPRELIHITPIRGTEIGTFDVGDLVGVECTSEIRGGFSGAQRVYEYTISWDEDGPCALSELQTSSDQGIPTP